MMLMNSSACQVYAVKDALKSLIGVIAYNRSISKKIIFVKQEGYLVDKSTLSVAGLSALFKWRTLTS